MKNTLQFKNRIIYLSNEIDKQVNMDRLGTLYQLLLTSTLDSNQNQYHQYCKSTACIKYHLQTVINTYSLFRFYTKSQFPSIHIPYFQLHYRGFPAVIMTQDVIAKQNMHNIDII